MYFLVDFEVDLEDESENEGNLNVDEINNNKNEKVTIENYDYDALIRNLTYSIIAISPFAWFFYGLIISLFKTTIHL